MRGLEGGIAVYSARWFAAVTVWKHVIYAELRRRPLARRKADIAAASAGESSLDPIEPIRLVPLRPADQLVRERRPGEEGGGPQPARSRTSARTRPSRTNGPSPISTSAPRRLIP